MSSNKDASESDVEGNEFETESGGSECRRLIQELKESYEDTFRNIENEVGSDGKEVKLKLMQSYISDLEEQNAVFLETVDDLLEKKAASARSEELKDMQIQELESDRTNLLELIRRVREENSWDTTGLTFNEVTRTDIFGTEDMFCGCTVGSVNDSQIFDVSRSPGRKSRVRYWRSQDDVRLEYIEDYGCALPPTRKHYNLHRRHSSPN